MTAPIKYDPLTENAYLRTQFEILTKQNDTLRATLATIQTEAERYPVPGGFTYAISGKLMGMVDEALR